MSLNDTEAEGFAALENSVETLIKKTVSTELEGKHYSSEKVTDWTQQILEKVVKGLKDLDARFKYLVTGIIMQKNGAGVCTSFSSYWHAERDGFCKVAWETEFLHCVVTCYGLALDLDSADEDF